VRLLVASLDGPELVVLDAEDGESWGASPSPERAASTSSRTRSSPRSTHRDANRVSFVHSGLSAIDHGDHQDLLQGPPYVLKTVNLGPRPGHFFARGHDIAVYADGDGSMAWLDARLLGISLDFLQIPGAGAGPGSLAVVDGFLIGGGQREGSVGVFDRSERELARISGCPGLHGQAVLAATVAFGCSDGVLLVAVEPDGTIGSHKLDNPAGAAEGVRVGTFVSDPDSPIMIADFGQGLALIDPAARSLSTVTLPATPAAMRFTAHGATLLVLTLDGMLHAFDPAGGEIQASVRLLEDVPGQAPPTLEVFGDHAFVTDPSHARVHLVDLGRMAVEAHHHLPFVPGSVAVMAIPGATIH
jgi:hypothetical protein